MAHGLTAREVERQWLRLQGTPNHCRPDAPCTLGSGILRLQASELDHWAQRGAGLSPDDVMRFIPASGAATRMFEALLAKDPDSMAQMEARWAEFPFQDDAEASGPCETVAQKWSALMERLALQHQPKGAIPFHREAHGVETAFEAQLGEWAETLGTGVAPLHFTLPALGFDEVWATTSAAAALRGVDCTASVQNPMTDTLALDERGRPFMMAKGPLFRPGGHGALLHNLQALAEAHPGRLISIKNIDNVRPRAAWPSVLPWRRALLGLTKTVVEARNGALEALEAGDATPARQWLERWPGRQRDAVPEGLNELRTALDRPLVVAGMVRNEGEPGGGPFWVRDDEGVLRAQIVESSEMDGRDADVRRALANATHFNPVDLVCGLCDASGRTYDLTQYVDGSRDFLVSRSHQGRPLWGLEHPGLWNGGMGRWNTVFVEVDSATFAPVKTVFDLLRPAHRAT